VTYYHTAIADGNNKEIIQLKCNRT